MEELLKQLLEGQKELQESIKEIQSEMATKKQLTRMETEIGTKVNALYDAIEVQFDANKRTIDSLKQIESKFNKMSLRTAINETREKYD